MNATNNTKEKEKITCECEKLNWYPYDGRSGWRRKQKRFSLGGVIAILIPLCFFCFVIGRLWQW